MHRAVTSAIVLATLLLATAGTAQAHCEIPCGIYGDKLRAGLMREHVFTIEKSIREIERLSKATPANHNQLVRWVSNKDHHADELRHILVQYFLAQRLKPVADPSSEAGKKLSHQLGLVHSLIVHAMKAKQTLDLQHTKRLRELLDEFEVTYFGKKVGTEHSH